MGWANDVRRNRQMFQILNNEAYITIMYMICPCCGTEMVQDTDIGNSIIYKCKGCGLTDSRLKRDDQEPAY